MANLPTLPVLAAASATLRPFAAPSPAPANIVNPILLNKLTVSLLVHSPLTNRAFAASAPVLTRPPTAPTKGMKEDTVPAVDIQSKGLESPTVPVGS